MKPCCASSAGRGKICRLSARNGPSRTDQPKLSPGSTAYTDSTCHSPMCPRYIVWSPSGSQLMRCGSRRPRA
ncbi:Uncharacterised protein [Mycobacteroides abscessus]|nr:Uncharacterised protein [Mycobacteroides abscessus]